MSVIWRKVWFDLWHNKVRTILAILSIAVGVFAIGAIFGMVDQLLPGMDRSHQASRPSHISLTLSDRITRQTADRLTNIDGVADIEAANTVSIRYKTHPNQQWQAGFLQMRNDYNEQKYDVLRLEAGRWPDRGDVALERLSGEAFGLDVGDQVIFELEKTDRPGKSPAKSARPLFTRPSLADRPFFTRMPKGWSGSTSRPATLACCWCGSHPTATTWPMPSPRKSKSGWARFWP